jgi:hypothetical protein
MLSFGGLGFGSFTGSFAARDVTGPTLVGQPVISADGLTITATYSEVLDPTSEPTLTLDGTDSVVSSVDVTGATVIGTLDTAAFEGETITVSSSGAPIRDLALNNAAALSGQAVTNNSEVGVTELIQLTTVGADAYGDMLTNTSALQECNPVSDIANNVQYVAYHTQGRVLKIGKRTLPDGAWTVDTSGITLTTNGDGHNFWSMGVDGSGRLHIAGDMHGVEMNYWRAATAGAYHVASWFAVPTTPGSTLEELVTYPFFIRLPNGDLLRLFRDGGSGNGNLVLERWRDASNGGDDAWHTLFTSLINGETIRSAYPHRMVFDAASGKLGIAWGWRETTGIATNHDWCFMYALLAEAFATWRKADGSTQTIPATQANAGYVATIAQDSGLDNSQGFTFDDAGRPIVVGYYDIAKVNGTGGQGISQFVLRYWDGSAWQQRLVPGDVKNQELAAYSLVGAATTDVVPLSVPLLLRRGARTFVIFRSTSRGEGIWAWVCEEATLTNWALERISSDTLGDWYPSCDEAYFRATGEVMLYHQRVTRNPGAPIGAQDAKVLRWRPAASYPYSAPAAFFNPESVAGCLFAGSCRANTINVVGTPGSNNGKVIDLLDTRAGSTRKFTQATTNQRPQLIYPGGIGGLQSLRHTKASTHNLGLTDATVCAAVSGVNTPFTVVCCVKLTTATVNDMIWAFGNSSSTVQYFHVALGSGGTALSFGRRSGSTEVTRATVTGLVAAGGSYVITVRFDGTALRVWINGVEAAWATDGNIASANTMTINAVTTFVRQRTTKDNPGEGELADWWLYNSALSQSDREAIEDAIGAERSITITH